MLKSVRITYEPSVEYDIVFYDDDDVAYKQYGKCKIVYRVYVPREPIGGTPGTAVADPEYKIDFMLPKRND